MKRLTYPQRPNATRLVQSQGLAYTRDTDPTDPFHHYWGEGKGYLFTQAEIAVLETAMNAMFAMCVEAGDYMVADLERANTEGRPSLMTRMGIPPFAIPAIVKTWNEDPAWGSVYGRFDARFGGLDHPDPAMRVPKFYEFNADTPTGLVESALIQWYWLEQTGHGNDQFNSISEKLVDAWSRNLHEIERIIGFKPTVHFAVGEGQESGEDELNTLVLRETCTKAGYDTQTLYIENVVLGEDGRFYDEQGEHIDVIFKLYPWETMVWQENGRPAFADMENIGRPRGENGTIWIESPYKMLWSNKALFAVLWKLFGDDPEKAQYLLPTYFEGDEPDGFDSYARKPMLGREGADVTLLDHGNVIEEYKREEYGAEGFVLQQLALPPVFTDEEGTDQYTVLGLWMVDGDPAGMLIRESKSPITDDFATFIPHSIADGPVTYDRKPVPSSNEIETTLRFRGLNQSVKEDA